MYDYIYIYNTGNGHSLWNEEKLTNDSTLGGSPWFQRNGDIVAYCDKTEYD